MSLASPNCYPDDPSAANVPCSLARQLTPIRRIPLAASTDILTVTMVKKKWWVGIPVGVAFLGFALVWIFILRGGVEIRWKFREGQRLRFSETRSSSVDGTGSILERIYRLDVQSVASDGTATLVTTTEKLNHIEAGKTTSMAEPGDPGLSSKPYTMSPAWLIGPAKGQVDRPNRMGEYNLPEGLVRPGDEWTYSWDGDSNGVTQTYRLEAVHNGNALITMTEVSRSHMSLPEGPVQFEVLDQSWKQTIVFSLARGHPLSIKLERKSRYRTYDAIKTQGLVQEVKYLEDR